MTEYIERENAYKLISEQIESETGMYSKGRNKGLNIAKSIIHDKEQCPTIDTQDLINRLEAENEQLKNNLKAMTETMAQCECCNIAKVEAYKEFAERLKEKGNRSLGDCFIVGWIDNLLKEMVGE